MQRRRRSRSVFAGLGAVTLALAAAAEAAGDWPQFRGAGRDGVSPETGLLDAWPEGGPPEVWRRPIGEGYSAVSVAGGRLYTMYAEAGEAGDDGPKPMELAAAFDAATGAEVWRTAVGEKIVTEFGNGPRSTPTVDGDQVVVLGSHGDLAALAIADGAVRWTLDLTETFGSKRPTWGFSTSVLVDGDQVVVASGGPEGKAYAALDARSGEVRWTTGEAPGPGFGSPLAVDMAGERRYLYVLGGRLRAVDRAGREVFSHRFEPAESHAMPIFIAPDRVYASGVGGDDQGAVMVRVVPGAEGATVEELWRAPFMRNHFSSSLHHGGYVYGFDNATFKCVSAETGEQQWAKRGLGKGSLIYADGNLVVLSDRGLLLLVAATPEGYREKGRVQALAGKCWTAPTLAGGRAYLRSHAEMVVYDLAADSGGGP